MTAPRASHRIVELCRGRDRNGEAFFAYIQMSRTGHAAYHAARAAGDGIDLTQYGKILASGWGHTPDADTHEMVMARYTARDEALLMLADTQAALTPILEGSA